jgi:hypothetical protein
MNRPNFSEEEWEKYNNELKEHYASEVENLQIPGDMTPQELTGFMSELDRIYSQARLDYYQNRRVYEAVKRTQTFALKSVHSRMTNKGRTEKEKEGLAVGHLRNNPLHGMKTDIFTALDLAEDGYMFMEEVIKTLEGKFRMVELYLKAIQLSRGR